MYSLPDGLPVGVDRDVGDGPTTSVEKRHGSPSLEKRSCDHMWSWLMRTLCHFSPTWRLASCWHGRIVRSVWNWLPLLDLSCFSWGLSPIMRDPCWGLGMSPWTMENPKDLCDSRHPFGHIRDLRSCWGFNLCFPKSQFLSRNAWSYSW